MKAITPRHAICLLALLLMAGCRTLMPGDDGQAQRPSAQSLAPALPYAQILVRLDGGPPGRMVLARQANGIEQWMAADGRTLWLRDGWRVVATRGLQTDLVVHQPLSPPVDLAAVARGETEVSSGSRYLRASDEGIGTVVAFSLQRTGSTLSIEAPGRVRAVQRVEETVTFPASGEAHTNIHWVDAESGRPVRSQQRIAATGHSLDITWLPSSSDGAPSASANEDSSQ